MQTGDTLVVDMAYVRVDEAVLRAVLEENEQLKKAQTPLRDAIQKSLENPVIGGQGQSLVISDEGARWGPVKASVVARSGDTGGSADLTKSIRKRREQAKTPTDKRAENRAKLREAKGMRPSRFDDRGNLL